MTTKGLKITAGYYVTESKLSKASKLQLLNFIQNEADSYQIMALLLDGKVTVLDKQAETIVKDRFDANKELQEALTTGNKDLIPYFNLVRRQFGECAKKCGRFAISAEKQLCKKRCDSARDEKILAARVKVKQAKMAAMGQTQKLKQSQIKVQGQ